MHWIATARATGKGDGVMAGIVGGDKGRGIRRLECRKGLREVATDRRY